MMAARLSHEMVVTALNELFHNTRGHDRRSVCERHERRSGPQRRRPGHLSPGKPRGGWKRGREDRRGGERRTF